MSAERKKLIWIAVSACAFILVLAATGFFLFAPKKSGGGLTAPASVGNTAVPKATDPQDFLMTPPPPPPSDQGRSGDVIVVYGDKPGLGATGQTGAATGSPASGTGTAPAAVALPPAATPVPTPAAVPAKTPGPPPLAVKPAPAKTKPTATKVKIQEYWIQAGSFTSRSRADDLKTALAAKGIASLITVKDIAGKSWYRVRVGPYPLKAQAQDWLTKIKTLPDCGSASLWSDIALRYK